MSCVGTCTQYVHWVFLEAMRFLLAFSAVIGFCYLYWVYLKKRRGRTGKPVGSDESHDGVLIDKDEPLRKGNALLDDRLDRKDFVLRVVSALQAVTYESGFTLAIEGEWGSGKTSTLAMIEELLEGQSPKAREMLNEFCGRKGEPPIIVHFNPWLVGDREALLWQFLTEMRAAINDDDIVEVLAEYAEVFEPISPEPIRSILSTFGKYKPSIEGKKRKLVEVLKEYSRRIIVFVDDIDRLSSQEVFEMIRVIKAVGDFPNVGYVLAWDSAYIVQALEQASVPCSEQYLEKVVQVRMAMPLLSMHVKNVLFNEKIESLEPAARENYFSEGEERLYVSLWQYSGLRDLIYCPRELKRIFNTVNLLEPVLRGEIVLADIIGLSTLMVSVPKVYEVLKKNPEWFVKCLRGQQRKYDDTREELERIYRLCEQPEFVKIFTNFLFPWTANNDITGFSSAFQNGKLEDPQRLAVALQVSITPYDISIMEAIRYLSRPEERARIEKESLSAENRYDFIELLGKKAKENKFVISDPKELIISIARLPHMQDNEGTFCRKVINTIKEIVKSVAPEKEAEIGMAIVKDYDALLVASNNLIRSHYNKEPVITLPSGQNKRNDIADLFSENVRHYVQCGDFTSARLPNNILKALAIFAPEKCPDIFEVIKSTYLDGFALDMFVLAPDSDGDRHYGIPKNTSVLNAFCTPEHLRELAEMRLEDKKLEDPVREAWKAFVEKRVFFVQRIM